MIASTALIFALLISPFVSTAPVPSPGRPSPPSPPAFNLGRTTSSIKATPTANPGGPIIPVSSKSVASSSASASPSANPGGPIVLPTSFKAPGKGCSLSGATIDFPAGQTALAVPSSDPKFVTLGVGVQNYTCSGTTWTSIGAVASLYDVSCAVGTPLFNASNSAAVTALKNLATKETPLISHFFTNATGTLSPRFNEEPFQTTQIGSTFSKTATLAAPDGVSVAWLQLSNIAGNLGSTAYRVDTIQGSPPASCDPTTDTKVLSVNYQAHYYFYA